MMFLLVGKLDVVLDKSFFESLGFAVSGLNDSTAIISEQKTIQKNRKRKVKILRIFLTNMAL